MARFSHQCHAGWAGEHDRKWSREVLARFLIFTTNYEECMHIRINPIFDSRSSTELIISVPTLLSSATLKCHYFALKIKPLSGQFDCWVSNHEKLNICFHVSILYTSTRTHYPSINIVSDMPHINYRNTRHAHFKNWYAAHDALLQYNQSARMEGTEIILLSN